MILDPAHSPDPSSSGVPNTVMVPFEIFSVVLIAEKIAEEAIKLCPHACPIPGSASYSARKATDGFPFPTIFSALKAVGIFKNLSVTLNPCNFRILISNLDDSNSLLPISLRSCIFKASFQ